MANDLQILVFVSVINIISFSEYITSFGDRHHKHLLIKLSVIKYGLLKICELKNSYYILSNSNSEFRPATSCTASGVTFNSLYIIY
jgi:hypothetical protein